jgi:hypothetical protein
MQNSAAQNQVYLERHALLLSSVAKPRANRGDSSLLDPQHGSTATFSLPNCFCPVLLLYALLLYPLPLSRYAPFTPRPAIPIINRSPVAPAARAAE